MKNGHPTNLVLPSSTKGPMIAHIGCEWNFEEELPRIAWLPPKSPDADKLDAIRISLLRDIDEAFADPEAIAKHDSNYFAGKALYKFALLALVSDALGESDAHNRCLAKLKRAMAPFLANTHRNSFLYDRTWGGIIGKRGVGSPGCDFGGSYYNDHHYHWGYFVQTAAIIGHFDQTWALENRAWVEALIRDVCNPCSQDPYFTTWRSFDWFCGHSWSNGIFEMADGKDQESTSEEMHFHYGQMLWGMAVGDSQFEERGRLMTAVAKRSIQTYFLMDSSNVAHPPEFIGNKVTGIFFENKCDYATWFSPRKECIHGIQMLPATPITEFVRSPRFVLEEWAVLGEIPNTVTDGWKSVLWMNYAIVDREAAFQQLQNAALDDGVSRTWALFFTATRPDPSFD